MKQHELTVIDANPQPFPWLKSRAPWKVVRSDWDDAQSASDVIVLVPASRLPSVSSVISDARRRKALRGVLVAQDVAPDMFTRVLDVAMVRSLRWLLSYTDPKLPRRVLNAWRRGCQTELIANATALDDGILVTTCALENLVVPWDALPALARLPKADRAKFEVQDFGSYLHWPEHDIHLDLEALRVAIDADARASARQFVRDHNEHLGVAIRTVREQANLAQREIVGLSERQVRRIENGEVQPRLAAYRALAAAHGLSLEGYLDTVAKIAQELAA